MSMLETVKNHPYITAGAVFAVGLVLIVMMAGNSDDAAPVNVYATPDNSSAVEANSALAMAQLQSNVALAGINQQGATDLASINAQLEIAKLENTRGAASDQLAAALGTLQVTTAADTQKFISQLSANVAQTQLTESTKQLQIQASTSTALATIQATQAKDLATINAATMSEMIAGQTKTQTNALLAEQSNARRATLEAQIKEARSKIAYWDGGAGKTNKSAKGYAETWRRRLRTYQDQLNAMPYSGELLT